jgi:hypothetical protein
MMAMMTMMRLAMIKECQTKTMFGTNMYLPHMVMLIIQHSYCHSYYHEWYLVRESDNQTMLPNHEHSFHVHCFDGHLQIENQIASLTYSLMTHSMQQCRYAERALDVTITRW